MSKTAAANLSTVPPIKGAQVKHLLSNRKPKDTITPSVIKSSRVHPIANKASMPMDTVLELWNQLKEVHAKALAASEKTAEMWKIVPDEGRGDLSIATLTEEERASVKAIQDKVGFTPFYEEEKALWDKKFDLEDKILSKVAKTPEGIWIQMKVACRRMGIDENDVDADPDLLIIEKGLKSLHLHSAAVETVNDSLIQHAREFSALVAQLYRLEQDHISHEDSSIESRNAMDDIEEAISAVEHIVPMLKANSIEGAAFQLLFLYCGIDMCVNGASEEIKERYQRYCNRIAYSIMDVLLKHSTLTPEEFGMNYWMPRNASLWVKNQQKP